MIRIDRMHAVIDHVDSLGAYTQACEIGRLLAAYKQACINLRTIDLHCTSLDVQGIRDLCKLGAPYDA
jgi:hypothetical protein